MNDTPRLRVALLLPPRCWAGSVLLARELFQVVGTLGTRSSDVGASALFDLVEVGATRAAVATFGGLALRPRATVRDLRGPTGRCRVVVLPAQFAPTADASPAEAALAAFAAAQHAAGATLLSLGGAALLARTGLLDGREATGLVSERALFARTFPRVRYVPSRRIVAQGDIVTVAGIGPTAEAVAHVVGRLLGAPLARRFLRHTSTEAMPAHEQLALWSAGYRRHRDDRVLAAQEIVERELHQLPDLAHLAARVGVSARALSRRWVAATGLDFRAYVATLRVELAETLVRTTDLPLVHVANECGFGSASALSRAFVSRFGQPPARWRVAARGAG